MRIVFGVLSLLVVVAIIGVLAKKQLGAVAPVAAPATSAPDTVVVPSGTPQQQVQQVQQAVQGAVQQARPMPDETK
jgi:Na+-transporting methylmalonyl-CoA/oxaloacetate decarboxylase gamma subunit